MSIIVKNLSKIYGSQKAVDNISFEIPKGQIVGFLGPNGAGKSTTMKMISGYLPPTSGTAHICGLDISNHSLEVRKKIGYLPEQNPLYYDMYIREYLSFTASIHQIKNKDKRIEEVIKMTGLNKESHKKIGAISKGYKQRVGLAQAMIHDPEVLILDEPTSGLDPNQILEIRDLIINLGEAKTVLLSTHIMQEVESMCNHIIIINNGKIVANDNIANLQKNQQQQCLIVTFENEVEQGQLNKIYGITKSEYIGNNSWKLFAKNTDELRKSIMKWALEKDININELRSESKSMEDVFRKATQNVNLK